MAQHGHVGCCNVAKAAWPAPYRKGESRCVRAYINALRTCQNSVSAYGPQYACPDIAQLVYLSSTESESPHMQTPYIVKKLVSISVVSLLPSHTHTYASVNVLCLMLAAAAPDSTAAGPSHARHKSEGDNSASEHGTSSGNDSDVSEGNGRDTDGCKKLPQVQAVAKRPRGRPRKTREGETQGAGIAAAAAQRKDPQGAAAGPSKRRPRAPTGASGQPAAAATPRAVSAVAERERAQSAPLPPPGSYYEFAGQRVLVPEWPLVRLSSKLQLSTSFVQVIRQSLLEDAPPGEPSLGTRGGNRGLSEWGKEMLLRIKARLAHIERNSPTTYAEVRPHAANTVLCLQAYGFGLLDAMPVHHCKQNVEHAGKVVVDMT